MLYGAGNLELFLPGRLKRILMHRFLQLPGESVKQIGRKEFLC